MGAFVAKVGLEPTVEVMNLSPFYGGRVYLFHHLAKELVLRSPLYIWLESNQRLPYEGFCLVRAALLTTELQMRIEYRVGFEPTVKLSLGGFADRPIRPTLAPVRILFQRTGHKKSPNLFSQGF
jgi:hypothetical protein